MPLKGIIYLETTLYSTCLNLATSTAQEQVNLKQCVKSRHEMNEKKSCKNTENKFCNLNNNPSLCPCNLPSCGAVNFILTITLYCSYKNYDVVDADNEIYY